MIKQEKLSSDFAEYEVSTGTLDEYHLIVNYHEFLTEYYVGYKNSGECEEVETIIKFLKFVDEVESEYQDYFVMSEQCRVAIAILVNETLPDMICELAPIDYYFGSNEGSTADIGFWPLSDIPDFYL